MKTPLLKSPRFLGGVAAVYVVAICFFGTSHVVMPPVTPLKKFLALFGPTLMGLLLLLAAVTVFCLWDGLARRRRSS